MQGQNEKSALSSAWKGLAVFITWTVTSFICHYCAKQFLHSGKEMWGTDNSFITVSVLTFAQILTCFTLLNIPFLSGMGSENERQDCLVVAVISHLLATMATNFSMTLIHADSTFAIKLMEPITSAIMSVIVIGTTLTPTSWCSLPVIVCGAVGFIGNPFTDMMLGYGAWYAVVSNIILAIRNLGIKFLNKGNTFTIRPAKIVGAYYSFVICLGVTVFSVASTSELTAYAYLLVSSTFHVVYSYVSTGIVLQYMSVVSHSVANIWKRILVVVMLYSVGHRQASPINGLFLLMCIVGLLIYVYGQSGKTQSVKDVTSQSRKELKVALVLVVMGAVLFNASFSLGRKTVSGVKLSPLHDHGGGLVQPLVAKDPSRGLLAYDALEGSPTAIEARAKLYADPKVREFLSWQLLEHANETDILARQLTSRGEVLSEVRRVLFDIATSVFGNYKYAFLLDMANFENKGDPAINMGELYLLRAMKIEVLFNCHYGNCNDKTLTMADSIAKNYKTEDIVILCSGGGNMGGYPINDHLRHKIFKKFPNHKIVVFPQSTWFHNEKHFNLSKIIYSSHKDLTLMMRDRPSLEFVRTHFPRPRAILAPDAALCIGPVPRFMAPIYDIIWLRRADGESPKYKYPIFPSNISAMVSDWWHFRSPSGKNVMENTFLMTTTGFMFAQRGRVMITDRLHGHVFAVLLDIPHVIIDNKIKKITNFRKSWTAALEKVRLANDSEHAIVLAQELLRKYDNTLPKPVGFMSSKP